MLSARRRRADTAPPPSPVCRPAEEGAGFHIVVGNPPYGANIPADELAQHRARFEAAQSVKGVQKGSADTFAMFVNQGYNLLKTGGVLSFIVPMSVTSSDSMTALHRLLEANCGTIRVASFANRPKQIFDAACIRTSIFSFQKSGTQLNKLLTTKVVRRRHRDTIGQLLANLNYVDSLSLKLPGRYPKIGQQIEIEIFTRLFTTNRTLANYVIGANSESSTHAGDIVDNARPVFYRSAGGRYFNVVTDYSTTESSSEKFFMVDEMYQVAFAALLSSSLFWLYQQAYSDGLNLKQSDLLAFPVPDMAALQSLQPLKNVFAAYTAHIERNARLHAIAGATTYNVAAFKEYKLRRSKHLIDQIDDFVCPLYGLSAAETEYVKNYELEFRLGDEE